MVLPSLPVLAKQLPFSKQACGGRPLEDVAEGDGRAEHATTSALHLEQGPWLRRHWPTAEDRGVAPLPKAMQAEQQTPGWRCCHCTHRRPGRGRSPLVRGGRDGNGLLQLALRGSLLLAAMLLALHCCCWALWPLVCRAPSLSDARAEAKAMLNSCCRCCMPRPAVAQMPRRLQQHTCPRNETDNTLREAQAQPREEDPAAHSARRDGACATAVGKRPVSLVVAAPPKDWA
mmetsp:Transcript_25341/g.46752  ORF Transcript_25341/g.46752 Transcript_25341/m.46752 type:complete len:231 (+) Transcript_25341:63-755(+)